MKYWLNFLKQKPPLQLKIYRLFSLIKLHRAERLLMPAISKEIR
jgi:hypothetical protein